MKLSSVLLIAAVIALSGCTELKSLRKTGEVPGKMDETNKTLDQTKAQMDRTNQTLDRTREAIHDQQLLLPLEEMLKPENWKDLSPVPFKLMPYGKKFAEAAQADELMDMYYLWMKEVQEVGPDSDVDWQGNEIPRSEDDAQALFKEKIAKLTILQIIAGFAPQTTVDQIVSHQISGDSQEKSQRYLETADAFMVMRARFINDVLVRNSILAGNLTNMGMVEDAINYVSQLDSIAVLPQAGSFKYDISGAIKYKSASSETVSYPFEFSDELPSGQDAPQAWWQKIKMQLANISSGPISPSANSEFASRKQKAEKTVDDRLAYWQNQQH